MVKKKRGFTAPASVWRRFLAFFVDYLILEFVVMFPLMAAFRKSLPEGSFFEMVSLLQSPEFASVILKISVISGFIVFVYFTLFEFKLNQTPGKMLFKINVVSEKKKFTFWNVVVSNLFLLTFIPGIILLWIVDLVHLLVSAKNQRWTEKISKILIVQRYDVR